MPLTLLPLRLGLILAIFLFLLSLFGIHIYEGSAATYYLFDITWLTLLVFTLCYSQGFVFFYLGLMLFMGFWVKFMANLILNIPLIEPTGYWANKLSTEYYWDKVLTISAVAALGIIIANLLIAVIDKGKQRKIQLANIPSWYQKYHCLTWNLLIQLTLIVVVINLWFHIYLTGVEPKLILPWHFNAIIFWIMGFFIPLSMTIILDWDIALNKNIKKISYVIAIAFMVSLSTLSRAIFLFWTVPYLIVFLQNHSIHESFNFLKKNKKLIFTFLIFIILNLISVSQIRTNIYHSLLNNSSAQQQTEQQHPTPAGNNWYQIKSLLVGRWVGLEAVMATTSYPCSGWQFFKMGILEKPSIKDSTIGIYSREVLKPSKYHKIAHIRFSSLPGIIGILNYSDSLFLICIGMIFICLLLGYTEITTYIAFNNKFLLSQQGLILSYWCVAGINIPYLGLINFLECISFSLLFFLASIFLNWITKYSKRKLSLKYPLAVLGREKYE